MFVFLFFFPDSVLQLEDCDEIDLNSTKSSISTLKNSKSVEVPSNNNGEKCAGAVAGGAVTYSGPSINRQRRGLLEGLWGCLRPVWTIIGKAAAAENKTIG